jgi:hypothetical protein
MPSIWFLTPSGLTVAVEPAMQVDQCRRPFRVPTVLVAVSYLRKTYVACGAVRQVSWPSLSSATAERGNQKPFAAAYLSSFPLGPELTSRPPESESSPEEETMLEAVANACVQPTFRSLLQGPG